MGILEGGWWILNFDFESEFCKGLKTFREIFEKIWLWFEFNKRAASLCIYTQNTKQRNSTHHSV